MYHPKRLAWWNSKARHNVVAAGRRSYKTETAKRKLVWRAFEKEGNYFFAAPTQGQAKKIAWQDLKDLSRPFISKINESNLIITLGQGSTIHCLGMDAPARIEGQMWHGGIMDEYGDMKPTVWTNHVQPVTADTGAWVDFIGVPEGQNHFFDLANYARTSGDDDWRFYTWISADVLPEEVISAAKRQLDRKTYLQEYEASFESTGTSAYYAFTAENVGNYPFNPTLPLIMAWDFNASELKPMCVAIIQQWNGKWHVVKEFNQCNTNTYEQCENISTYLIGNGFRSTVTVTGDYSGHRKESNATRSDYAIIERYFGTYSEYYTKTRPTLSVRDRVAATNAMFCNMAGERTLFVDSGCVGLIEDLYKTRWKEDAIHLDDADPKRTHATDGLSYFPYNFYPIDRKEISYG